MGGHRANGPAPAQEALAPMQNGSFQDDRRLVKTKTPGIYKRGDSYIVRYRDPRGRTRKRFARTLAEARDLKATLRADVTRGEYRNLSRLTFAEYASSWLKTYQGRTSRGIRPETIADYGSDLGLRVDDDSGEWVPIEGPKGGHVRALAFFGRMLLAQIEPRTVKEYAVHVAAQGLSPNSVRLALAPVRALLATAFEEGMIRSNPAAGLRIAQRVEEDADSSKPKALTEDELRALLSKLPQEWRPFVEFLAQTGLRIGEAVALRWGDVDFGHRRVRVRRRLYRGTYAPPKSRYGRRDVPLSTGVGQSLWERRKREKPGDDEPLFASSTGGPLDASNVFARIFKPAARAAGVPWAGFHTLRHTCATMLFRNGLNAKQVQVWLGHHSPAFTLAVYVHLLPDDLPEPTFWTNLSDQVETPEATA